jgi:solute carrier family 35, member E1
MTLFLPAFGGESHAHIFSFRSFAPITIVTDQEGDHQTCSTDNFNMRTISYFHLVACLVAHANAFVAHPHNSVRSPRSVFSFVPVLSPSKLYQSADAVAVVEEDIPTPAAVVPPENCDPYDPEGSNYCTVDPAEIVTASPLQRRLRLAGLFALWYVLNVGYNIGNKSVLNALPIPWTAATIELFFGFPYVALLWLTKLRATPKLSLQNIYTLSSQAFFLAATHVLGVISFGAGAISFTHILKATEPVWSALILGVCFREILPIPVYLSLIPIIGGVGLASLKELSFTWLSFTSGTLSAVTSASKAILSKKVLSGKPLGENLTPANMFAVLTILGFLMILPASLYMEGPTKVSAAFSSALAAGYTMPQLFRLLSISGFLYYLYNEVAFLALSEVAPVTHAVTNTVKRVVIILASVLVFRNPVSRLGALGSALAIGGATVYSIAKSQKPAASNEKKQE